MGIIGGSGCYQGVATYGQTHRVAFIEQAFPDAEVEGEGTEILTFNGIEIEVDYQVRTGHKVMDGDIVIGEIGETQHRAAVRRGDRWEHAVVPYEFDDVGDETRANVLEAISIWESATVLRFVPRNGQKDYLRIISRADDGCWSSNIGRDGGRQRVNLSPNCGLQSAVHELGHVIGLWHEHS